MVKSLLITGLSLLLVVSAARRTATAQLPFGAPVEINIPVAPTPVRGGGKTHLAYELHVTNFGSSELTLTRFEALGDNNASPLARYEGAELTRNIARPGLSPNSAEKQRIGGGLRAILFVWLTVESPAAVPATLRHRLTFNMTDAAGVTKEVTEDGASVAVRRDAPLVIEPPLRGGEWLAANGPSNTSGHRRALIPLGGGTHIAQRFAIDWVQLREDGRTFTGDQKDNKNYRCYGAEALAVADAVVVGVKDGIPENVPGLNSRAVPITLETVGGNYVILDLGKNRYAFYAHLQPGKIRVKVGDKVRRGQVLGFVGNSGNSTEPHLHFHIGDANSPLASEGLPYVLTAFEVQGKGWGWKSPGPNAPTEKRAKEIPLENEVVRFPANP
ncbi:MAG TPA: M23 family metallopeptidase [Blastocatellia bacterium]|nr:M23 family metallopeptidase [Blastocatellia bacterium]